MGIYYSHRKIYGISFKLDNEILFEKTYTDEMNLIEIQEVKDIYDNLTYAQMRTIHIRFYISCSSTYDISERETFLSWVPANTRMLENLFRYMRAT
jgi:hypothetical protein